jgi:hypothetical protein
MPFEEAGFNVFLQLDGVEAHLANGGVNDAVFVGAITNLASFSVFNRGSYVWSYSTNLRVRHQTTWTEDLAQLTYNAHGIRGCDYYVIVQVAAFHFGSQVVHTYTVSAGSQSGLSSWTLGEHSNANSLASAVWQHSSAANNLVGFTRVYTQVYSNVERLAELDSRQLSSRAAASTIL